MVKTTIRIQTLSPPHCVCPDISGRRRWLFTHAKRRRTLTGRRLAVGGTLTATTVPTNNEKPIDENQAQSVAVELPEPPSHVSIGTVLPYLLKATFTTKTNYRRVVAAASFVLISKVTGLLAPYFLKVAVERLGQGTAFVTHCIANIMLFGFCRVLSGITQDLQFPVFAPVALDVGRKITYSVFRHVLELDLEYHLNARSGTITTILERGSRSIQHLFRAVIFRFVPTALELVVVAIIFSRLFTPLAAGVILTAVAGYVLFSIVLVSISVGYRRRLRDLENQKSGKAVDVLQNMQTVALFDNQHWEASQYNQILGSHNEANFHYEQLYALFSSGQTLIITLGLTMCLAVTVIAGPGGRMMTPADLVFMQGMILQLWAPLSFFGWLYRETRQSIIDMQDFLHILQTKKMIEDGHLDLNEERRKRLHLNGAVINGATSDPGVRLRFDGVTFSYTPERNVLKCIDLDIPAGSSIAFVGHSGSGKSTLLSLLVRLYDPESGSVTYDGIDVRKLTRSSLRASIGVVPQETTLFNDTIYNNILYGKPTATREEVCKASKMAKLDQAIRQLPDGYETIVGEQGLKLSGGEKQRVAIARAFLRSPKILVCDEATSSLDSATEQDIMASLSQLARGRTTIFVAHRLSTIQHCDKIVVLSDGHIIEQGTHDELLQLGLAYFDMWQSQARRDAFDIDYRR